MNPLKQLNDFGQSVWLDNIHRGMLISGELASIPTTPAIINGIYNATGVRCYRLPADKKWLKSALAEMA